MKILRLSSENVKRLSAVEISPNGDPVIVVAGENEAGKSSVIDSIVYALGGKESLPAKPVRDGQERAEIVLDLGDYIVRKTITAAGRDSLTVTNRDGAKFPSPQALLDGLVGELSFDPQAFANMTPAEQAATLRALAKIDTTPIDTARKAAYDERTLVNRDLTQAQAALAKLPQHEGVSTDPIDATEITAQLESADRLAEAAAAAERALAEVRNQRAAAAERAKRNAARIEELQAQLAEAEAESERCGMAVAMAEDAVANAENKHALAARKVPDRTGLRKRLGELAEQNRKAADNARRAEMSATVAERKKAADALTAKIAELDQRKADLLATATFPVEGLGLDEHGVTWNGLPFEQAATSIRIRASVAIGCALNPKLKVLLIRAGNDLGPKNLQAIAEQAEAAGMQVWVERIAGGDGLQTVVIEDGKVVSQCAI